MFRGAMHAGRLEARDWGRFRLSREQWRTEMPRIGARSWRSLGLEMRCPSI